MHPECSAAGHAAAAHMSWPVHGLCSINGQLLSGQLVLHCTRRHGPFDWCSECLLPCIYFSLFLLFVYLHRLEPSTDQVKKPVNTESLDSWRTSIPPAILEQIWEECDMLKELGYPKFSVDSKGWNQCVKCSHFVYFVFHITSEVFNPLTYIHITFHTIY